ncbi:MAG: dephospho-CoA kinase [Lachnospiraceae bacterium]|nr:dephospho-CoA kinase [Lachnospiraceae bacterium]
MHITLTGNLGSGKSTIAKIMAEKFGYTIYSTGKIQRELAEERGLTVLEMNKLMQQDHSYDNIIDEKVTELSKNSTKELFFDSRLAWHFAEKSFKVFLSVGIDEAARRVFNDDKRGDVEKYKSQEEAKANLIERARTEDVRYKEIYGLDYFNMNNYDLVLDSTYTKPELLAEVLINEKKKYEEMLAANGLDENFDKNKAGNEELKAKFAPRILLAPSRLLGEVAGNTRDNDEIYDSAAVIKRGAEDIEIVSGRDEIEKAARDGYEFVSVAFA